MLWMPAIELRSELALLLIVFYVILPWMPAIIFLWPCLPPQSGLKTRGLLGWGSLLSSLGMRVIGSFWGNLMHLLFLLSYGTFGLLVMTACLKTIPLHLTQSLEQLCLISMIWISPTLMGGSPSSTCMTQKLLYFLVKVLQVVSRWMWMILAILTPVTMVSGISSETPLADALSLSPLTWLLQLSTSSF